MYTCLVPKRRFTFMSQQQECATCGKAFTRAGLGGVQEGYNRGTGGVQTPHCYYEHFRLLLRTPHCYYKHLH